jgi:hypothetical protein
MINPTISVEEALAELRAMFPGKVIFLKDEVEWWSDDVSPCRATVIGIDYPPSKGRQFTDNNLLDCMAQVRTWKQEQRR